MRCNVLLVLPCLVGPLLGAADYYISPGGSDSAAGTSSAQAWQTLAKANTRNFAAGDRILLEGGQSFTDTGLSFDAGDTGTAGSPITVGSYGTGRATIRPPANKDAIYIYNTAGISITDLILVGTGSGSTKNGIHAYCDLASGAKLPYLHLANLDASAFRRGITIGAWHASFSGFSDVTVTSCSLHDNISEGFFSYGFTTGSGASQQSHANLQILDTVAANNLGDPTSTQHSGSGILVSGTKVGLVDRCIAHDNGGGATLNVGGGPVGIWVYAADSVVIQNSLSHDQHTVAGAGDGGGFDIDGGSTNCTVQYCYSYQNDGPGYLIAEYAGATPLQNATYRYNVSWRDGFRGAAAQASGFAFWNAGAVASDCQGIAVYNNLVYAENTENPCVGYFSGAMSGIRLSNNIFVVKGGQRLIRVSSGISAFTFQGNLYWATDGNYAGGWSWNGSVYTTLAAWRAASGTPETISGSALGLQADPLLSGVVAGAQPTTIAAMQAMTAFRLLAGSPAIDAGRDLRTATYGSIAVGGTDLFGHTIPQGAGFDIGVHEVTPVPDTTPPTTPPAPVQSGGAPATPVFSGSTEAGAMVRIYDGATLIGTVSANGSGAWTFTAALAIGTHPITVTATDTALNTSSPSAATTIVVAMLPPATPGLAAIVNDSTSATPTLSGSTDPGATVSIYDGATLLGQVVADGGGDWTWTVSPALGGGSHTLTWTSTNAGGASGHSPGTLVQVARPSAGLVSVTSGAGSSCGAGALGLMLITMLGLRGASRRSAHLRKEVTHAS